MSEMYQELVRVAQEMERRDAERLLIFCRPENEFEVRNVLAQVPAFVNVKLHVSPHVPENRIIIAKEIDVRKTSVSPAVEFDQTERMLLVPVANQSYYPITVSVVGNE